MIKFRDIFVLIITIKVTFVVFFPPTLASEKVAVQVNEVETTRVSYYVGPEIRKVIHFRNNRKFSSASLF
jgi:hypothetical protein